MLIGVMSCNYATVLHFSVTKRPWTDRDQLRVAPSLSIYLILSFPMLCEPSLSKCYLAKHWSSVWTLLMSSQWTTGLFLQSSLFENFPHNDNLGIFLISKCTETTALQYSSYILYTLFRITNLPLKESMLKTIFKTSICCWPTTGILRFIWSKLFSRFVL